MSAKTNKNSVSSSIRLKRLYPNMTLRARARLSEVFISKFLFIFIILQI